MPLPSSWWANRLVVCGTVGIVLTVLGIVALGKRRGDQELGEDSLEELIHQERELDRAAQALRLRIKRKTSMTRKLLDGRASLLEAAAYFRALDRVPPVLDRKQFRRAHPGNTDEERYCRMVIRFAQTALRDQSPAQAQATLADLTVELEEHLRRGTLRLPEVEVSEKATSE